MTRREFMTAGATLGAYAGLSRMGLGSTPAPETDAGQKDRAWPAYMALHASGELKRRAERLWAVMESCRLCPRQCGANRLAGKKGFCQSPGTVCVVSGAQAHFGEERPLVGGGGSGTIFFSHCGLRCVFCQNWTASWTSICT